MAEEENEFEADSVRLLFDENEPTRVRRYTFPPQDITVLVRSAVEERPGHLQSGIILWPGASALAHYLCELETETQTYSKVVELGAGCGLCGLVAAALLERRATTEALREVMFTDRDWTSLKVIKSSGLENKFTRCKLRRKVLLWTEENAGEVFPTRNDGYDLAIGSDLIYSTETAKALFCTLVRIMPDKGWRFILSSSFRDPETTSIIESVCAKLKLKRNVLHASYHACLLEEYSF